MLRVAGRAEAAPTPHGEIDELVAALGGLRRGARVQSSEAELRAARQARTAAQEGLQTAMALNREAHAGTRTEPAHEITRLAGEVNAAEDAVRAARALLDDARQRALPGWLSELEALEQRATAALQPRLEEVRQILDALNVAARFLTDQRAPAPPLVAVAGRMSAALRPILDHVAASSTRRGVAGA